MTRHRRVIVDVSWYEGVEIVRRGRSAARRAWHAAAEAADRAVAETADLVPWRGRARPLAEKSRGHPDPGATSPARCAAIVAKLLPRSHPAG